MARLIGDAKPRNLDILMTLASLEKTAELACRVSAEDARDPHCRELLSALGHQYALFARALRLIAMSFGGPPPSMPIASPSAASALLDALSEHRDGSTLLGACEAAERATVDAYRDARRRAWPPFVDALLDRHIRVHTAARFGLLARRRHGDAVVLDQSA
jgi:hypothetical protein